MLVHTVHLLDYMEPDRQKEKVFDALQQKMNSYCNMNKLCDMIHCL